MVEKFDKELIIHYRKNSFTIIYKRVITKLPNGKFNVTTYYKENGIKTVFNSEIEFTKEQIEELIDAFFKEFNIKKTVVYK